MRLNLPSRWCANAGAGPGEWLAKSNILTLEVIVVVTLVTQVSNIN